MPVYNPPVIYANPTAVASDVAVNGVLAKAIRADGAPAVQKCSNTVFGLAKVDGTTITAAGGVISGAAAGFELTDGTTDVTGVTKITVSGGLQVGGATPNATLTTPNPTTSQAGAVTIDNITIKATGNKISTISSILFHPGMQSGRLYTAPGTDGNGSSQSFATGTIWAIPFYCPQVQTFTQISVDQFAANGNHAHMGVYNNSNGQPSTLLIDCGQITFTGAFGLASLTGQTINLNPGWYWLAITIDATFNMVTMGTGITNWLRGVTSGNIANNSNNVSGTFAYAALPNNFPTIVELNAAVPKLWLGF